MIDRELAQASPEVLNATEADLRNLWSTPDGYFSWLDSRYGRYDVDGAASEWNTRCPLWFGPGSPMALDALSTDPEFSWWKTISAEMRMRDGRDPANIRIFLNPPYHGRGSLLEWLKRVVHETSISPIPMLVSMLPPTPRGEMWNSIAEEHARIMEIPYPRVRYIPPPGVADSTPNGGTCHTVIVTPGTFPDLARRRSFHQPWSVLTVEGEP